VSPSERDYDRLVRHEEAAAAAEAAGIGGIAGDEDLDPVMRPVYEAGGGEAEGFELAEADLIDNAQHGDGHGEPLEDAFSPERESDLAGSDYGEADEPIFIEGDDEQSHGRTTDA
jgi:hypothetical protein